MRSARGLGSRCLCGAQKGAGRGFCLLRLTETLEPGLEPSDGPLLLCYKWLLAHPHAFFWGESSVSSCLLPKPGLGGATHGCGLLLL